MSLAQSITHLRRWYGGRARRYGQHCGTCTFYHPMPTRTRDFCLRGGVTQPLWACRHHTRPEDVELRFRLKLLSGRAASSDCTSSAHEATTDAI